MNFVMTQTNVFNIKNLSFNTDFQIGFFEFFNKNSHLQI